MGNIHQFYLQHIAEQTGYRATWEPNRPLYIGAIVKLEKGVFSIISDLKKEGTNMEVLDDDSVGMFDYTSNQSVKISIKLAGQVPLDGSALTQADAGFSIDFADEKSIVFLLDKTQTSQITNINEIEKHVIKLVISGKWQKDWLIVTQLVKATAATIIVSYSGNSKIDLKAQASFELQKISLTDSSLGLSVVNELGRNLKVIAANGITPLYRVMGFNHPLFGRQQLSTKGSDKEAIDERFKIQPFDKAEIE